jgi:hypothetical protein
MSNLWHRIQAVLGAGLVYLAAMQPQLTGKAGQLAAIILGIAALVGADPKKLKGTPPALLLLVFLLPLQGGCALFQKPAVQKVVKCTEDVIGACSSDVLPTVAACLAAPANPTPCLLALVTAGSCASTAALACRVQQAAQPSVIMTFVSPTEAEAAAAKRRELNAQRFYADVGLKPEAP